MTFEEQAADFIAEWEGFQAHAYWDVNHWRVGYGSDTEGPDAAPVVRDTITTVARSKQNLMLRIGAFKTTLVEAVTPYNFAAMNQNQQVALLDMVYNYGHLPIKWMRDAEVMATLILQRGRDNNGINLPRRRAESSLYLTPMAVEPLPTSISTVPPQKASTPVAASTENPTVKTLVDALETFNVVLQDTATFQALVPAPFSLGLQILSTIVSTLATELKPFA